MPIAANQSFLGIAKEATPGTAVAATAYLPVSGMKPNINVEYLTDDNLRGSNVKSYDMRPGPQWAQYDIDGSVYADTFGFLVTGVLGDVTTTGASAPFSHAVTILNNAQPPTYTLSDYNGFNTRQFAGSKVSEVGLKFAGNGLLDYSAKCVASGFATTSKPTQSFTAPTAVAAWQGISTIGGSASSLIVNGDINIKRTVEPIHNVDGAATPYAIFAGGDLEVTGSFVAVYEDDTLLTPYLAGTQQILDFNWSQGAGATLQQVKVHMSTAQIVDAQINRSGGKYVELACKFEALANTTDKGSSGGYGPVTVTLQNQLAAATYR